MWQMLLRHQRSPYFLVHQIVMLFVMLMMVVILLVMVLMIRVGIFQGSLNDILVVGSLNEAMEDGCDSMKN